MRVYIFILSMIIFTGCSSQGTLYQISKERHQTLNSVPLWFINDHAKIKECENKENNLCIFGFGTATSPDLNLAMEKAKMIAKSELADIIRGEINQSSKQYTKESGEINNRIVDSEIEVVLVNTIENTSVKGYEIYRQDINQTKNGYYRAFVGLKLPLNQLDKISSYEAGINLNAKSTKERSAEIETLWEDFMEDM